MHAHEQGGFAADDRFYPFPIAVIRELGDGRAIFLDFDNPILRVIQQLILPVVGDVALYLVAVSSPLGGGVIGVSVVAQRGRGMGVGRTTDELC